MENFITKSKYFNGTFNTAIFSDPIRIYFSQKHESHALEIYFHLQKRKNQWEKYLRQTRGGRYCYIMLYADSQNYETCFDKKQNFAPGEFGNDYIVGINGPLNEGQLDSLLADLDHQIGVEA
jgi:hypothetical protein